MNAVPNCLALYKCVVMLHHILYIFLAEGSPWSVVRYGSSSRFQEGTSTYVGCWNNQVSSARRIIIIIIIITFIVIIILVIIVIIVVRVLHYIRPYVLLACFSNT